MKLHKAVPASHILWFVIFSFFSIFTVSGANPDVEKVSVDELFRQLDELLLNYNKYVEEKENVIERLRTNLRKASEPDEQYWINRDLYTEFSNYDSDSAIMYAQRCYDIARKLGRQSWMDEMLVNMSYVYSATGLFEEANECLERIDENSLSAPMYLNFFENKLFYLTHKDQYVDVTTVENPYTKSTESLLESLGSNLPQTDPKFSWFLGWRSLRSKEKSEEAITTMHKVLEGRTYETARDAKDAWLMSRLYERVGDEDNKLRYLILSAMADIKASNREIASMEELANDRYLSSDLDRANNYINYSILCANEYKSRVRVSQLSRIQQAIAQAYQAESEKQQARINNYMIALVVILLFLTLALAFIVSQMRRLRESKRALDEANSQLNERLEELQEAHLKLAEANNSLSSLYSSAKQGTIELSNTNNAKEKYIADIFAVCSNYISKIEDFRKKINRMIIAGRIDEVRDLTKSTELSTSEIKELHHTFDEFFLKIYPDFVQDFNKLLRPEEQVVLKKGELLNTELRIYALVRLGINDSVKIASFLHCSVQTVYNTRQRVRNKAVIPKDHFAETVSTLGKISY